MRTDVPQESIRDQPMLLYCVHLLRWLWDSCAMKRSCQRVIRRRLQVFDVPQNFSEIDRLEAASIVGLLRMRQHRHVSDAADPAAEQKLRRKSGFHGLQAMRRQFQDYLLVLRWGHGGGDSSTIATL